MRVLVILIFQAFVLFFYSCNRSEENQVRNRDENSKVSIVNEVIVENKVAEVFRKDTLDYLYPQKYTFLIDTQNEKEFGYSESEDASESIGITSLILDDSSVYFVDSYHKNIKRVDLFTGEKISSSKIQSYNNPWLKDIRIFKEYIYVLSDLDSIYVFNKKLKYIKSIPVVRGRKIFYPINELDLSFYLINDRKIISIGEEGRIISQKDTLIGKVYNLWQAHGKKIQVENKDEYTLLNTEYVMFKTTSNFKSLSDKYNGINFEYTKKNLVYFNLDSSKITIEVYQW